MRIFIGIEIPTDLKKKIVDLQDRFFDFDIKLVEEENLHFCLKFLGEVEDEKREKIKEILRKIGDQFEQFNLKIQGIGAFPSRSYARVVWLGVKEGYQNFSAIAETLDDSLSELGFEREKEIVPHLTLGRVRSGRNKNELLVLLRELENVEIGSFNVNEIKIIQSFLSPKGPTYREIFKVELK